MSGKFGLDRPILLVGCGKMGGALLAGWIAQGLPVDQILVVEPAVDADRSSVPGKVSAITDVTDITEDFNPVVIIFAIKPQLMGKVVPLYRRFTASNTVFLSIAAGTPIEAIQNEVSKVAIPEELSKNGEHFGLKVSGDSMIEAGINDGDTVIVKKSNTADNGQIVVALIDDQEAMLKRIRKKGKVVALESANKRYETKIFGPDRVKVQGILVSLYRKFH